MLCSLGFVPSVKTFSFAFSETTDCVIHLENTVTNCGDKSFIWFCRFFKQKKKKRWKWTCLFNTSDCTWINASQFFTLIFFLFFLLKGRQNSQNSICKHVCLIHKLYPRKQQLLILFCLFEGFTDRQKDSLSQIKIEQKSCNDSLIIKHLQQRHWQIGEQQTFIIGCKGQMEKKVTKGQRQRGGVGKLWL